MWLLKYRKYFSKDYFLAMQLPECSRWLLGFSVWLPGGFGS